MNARQTTSARRPRRWVRRLLLAIVLVGALVVGLVWQFGPRFGVHLVPPSPQAYADEALRQMDAGYYAEGEEWTTARAEAVAATRGAESYADTLPALRKALAVAGGRHSHLFDAGQTLASVDTERPLPEVRSSDGITTLVVPKLSADDESFANTYAATLSDGIVASKQTTTCGWIVDARNNHGGNMYPMLAGLSPLLTDGTVGGFVDRNGTQTELTINGGKALVGSDQIFSVADHPKITQPVAVLQGPDTASSGEMVVLAFKGQQNARSFGVPTAGLSSANQTSTLYDNTMMLLTVAVDTDRTGATYGGPIRPDTEAGPDNAAQAARTWLQSQC